MIGRTRWRTYDHMHDSDVALRLLLAGDMFILANHPSTVVFHPEHVTRLMRDDEDRVEAVLLAERVRTIWITHPLNWCEPRNLSYSSFLILIILESLRVHSKRVHKTRKSNCRFVTNQQGHWR